MQIYDVDNAEPIHLVAQQQFDAIRHRRHRSHSTHMQFVKKNNKFVRKLNKIR